MIAVKVVYSSSGRPVEGSTVCLGFSFGMSDTYFTNENGNVFFEDYDSGRFGSIYVDGTEVFEGYLPVKNIIGI